MPTKTNKTTRAKRTDWYVCVQSFAGNDVTVSAGTRLRGNHDLLKRFGRHFEREQSAGEDLASLRARWAERQTDVAEVTVEAPPEPAPPADGQVRLRVSGADGEARLTLGSAAGPELSGREFVGGQTFDLDADRASALFDEVGAWLEVVEPEVPAKG